MRKDSIEICRIAHPVSRLLETVGCADITLFSVADFSTDPMNWVHLSYCKLQMQVQGISKFAEQCSVIGPVQTCVSRISSSR
jgi:hypothetical protein